MFQAQTEPSALLLNIKFQMLPRKSREMASKKKGEMYETKLEVQKAKTYEKKV